MITKEQAREIYNHYSQIDTCEKLINDLKTAIERDKEKDPPKILYRDPNYHPNGSIVIEVPYFDNQSGCFMKDKGSRIYNISYPSAIRVLMNHVKHLKSELSELQKSAEL